MGARRRAHCRDGWGPQRRGIAHITRNDIPEIGPIHRHAMPARARGCAELECTLHGGGHQTEHMPSDDGNSDARTVKKQMCQSWRMHALAR